MRTRDQASGGTLPSLADVSKGLDTSGGLKKANVFTTPSPGGLQGEEQRGTLATSPSPSPSSSSYRAIGTVEKSFNHNHKGDSSGGIGNLHALGNDGGGSLAQKRESLIALAGSGSVSLRRAQGSNDMGSDTMSPKGSRQSVLSRESVLGKAPGVVADSKSLLRRASGEMSVNASIRSSAAEGLVGGSGAGNGTGTGSGTVGSALPRRGSDSLKPNLGSMDKWRSNGSAGDWKDLSLESSSLATQQTHAASNQKEGVVGHGSGTTGSSELTPALTRSRSRSDRRGSANSQQQQLQSQAPEGLGGATGLRRSRTISDQPLVNAAGLGGTLGAPAGNTGNISPVTRSKSQLASGGGGTSPVPTSGGSHLRNMVTMARNDSAAEDEQGRKNSHGRGETHEKDDYMSDLPRSNDSEETVTDNRESITVSGDKINQGASSMGKHTSHNASDVPARHPDNGIVQYQLQFDTSKGKSSDFQNTLRKEVSTLAAHSADQHHDDILGSVKEPKPPGMPRSLSRGRRSSVKAKGSDTGTGTTQNDNSFAPAKTADTLRPNHTSPPLSPQHQHTDRETLATASGPVPLEIQAKNRHAQRRRYHQNCCDEDPLPSNRRGKTGARTAAGISSTPSRESRSSSRNSLTLDDFNVIDPRALSREVNELLSKPARQPPAELANKMQRCIDDHDAHHGKTSHSRRICASKGGASTSPRNFSRSTKGDGFYNIGDDESDGGVRPGEVRAFGQEGHMRRTKSLSDEAGGQSPFAIAFSKMRAKSAENECGLGSGEKTGDELHMLQSNMHFLGARGIARHRWKFVRSYVLKLIRATAVFKRNVNDPRHHLQGYDPTDLEAQGLSYMLKAHQSKLDIVFSSKDQQRELCACFQFDSYPAGTLIVKEGHDPMYVYFILSGQCEVFKTKKNLKSRVNILNSGDFFGEHPTATKRTVSVACTMLTELLKVPTHAYLNVLHMADSENIATRVSALSTIPHFDQAHPSVIEKAAQAAQLLTFQPQEPIIHEGVENYSIFWIVSGTCRAMKLVPFVKRITTPECATHSKKYTLVPYEEGVTELGPGDKVVTQLLNIRELVPGDHFPEMTASVNPERFNKIELMSRLSSDGPNRADARAYISVVASSRVEVIGMTRVDYARIATNEMILKTLADRALLRVPMNVLQESMIEKRSWNLFKKKVVDEITAYI
ncbi:hypothetical protein HDU76_011721 [Blyttiomyces sp. JEL0837]|nr:hypothetical protein HDU76_011721 [Blyttiomyces sp. JEL0837]